MKQSLIAIAIAAGAFTASVALLSAAFGTEPTVRTDSDSAAVAIRDAVDRLDFSRCIVAEREWFEATKDPAARDSRTFRIRMTVVSTGEWIHFEAVSPVQQSLVRAETQACFAGVISGARFKVDRGHPFRHTIDHPFCLVPRDAVLE